MYPFENDYTLLKNCWYVGARADEVGTTILSRTILEEPVIFYRTQAGQAVALSGICPHRFYPLSEGKRDGDDVVCRYHGITFGPDGHCVRIPSQDAVPARAHVRAYPVIERGPFIWIWPGDPARADEALLPDMDKAAITAPDFWVHGFTHFQMKGRYTSLVENLTDLTHIGFLHSDTIADGSHWVETPLTFREEDGVLQILRPTNEHWTGFLEFTYGADKKVDGELQMHTRTDIFSTAYIRTSGLIIESIEGLASVPKDYGQMYFHHFVTPETKTTTHYFGALSRNFHVNDPACDKIWSDTDYAVRCEDAQGVEHMEPLLVRFGDVKDEILRKADAGSIRVRRALQEKLNAERVQSRGKAGVAA